MQTNQKLTILEQKTDAEIALAIHSLDPDFDAERNRDTTALFSGFPSAPDPATGALTSICLDMRTL
jgi:hypothetical protein